MKTPRGSGGKAWGLARLGHSARVGHGWSFQGSPPLRVLPLRLESSHPPGGMSAPWEALPDPQMRGLPAGSWFSWARGRTGLCLRVALNLHGAQDTHTAAIRPVSWGSTRGQTRLPSPWPSLSLPPLLFPVTSKPLGHQQRWPLHGVQVVLPSETVPSHLSSPPSRTLTPTIFPPPQSPFPCPPVCRAVLAVLSAPPSPPPVLRGMSLLCPLSPPSLLPYHPFL